MNEKRRYPRVRADLEWLFVVEIQSQYGSMITETKDISCSGIKCRVDDFFPKGKEVSITLLLPLTEKGLVFEKVKCCAKTVRCVPMRKDDYDVYEVGFTFIDLKMKDKEKIDHYIMDTQKI